MKDGADVLAEPVVPDVHMLRQGRSCAMFVPASGRIYPVDPALAAVLEPAIVLGDRIRVRQFIGAAGVTALPVRPPAPRAVSVRSLSLAISGNCNLACTYCYAEQGSFGGKSRAMPRDVAFAAIDRLIGDADAGETVRVVFMGGEPFTQRGLLQELTSHAVRGALSQQVEIAFSVTTNATLLNAGDADFLNAHGFAVTISLDGVGEVNDRLRPALGGGPTYRRATERARLLLDREARRARVFARVSVTPGNLDLPQTLVALSSLGFDGVHFSPVVSSPTGRGQMDERSLDTMLATMIACSDLVEARLNAGAYLPFTNLVSTLNRIHRRARADYPCAAGGSYAGVSAAGTLHACHRFVDDDATRLGTVDAGVDPELQIQWLADRHVDAQADCASCWARYLCGGGCHYETLRRGRVNCDYIRGWLDHCLNLYVRLGRERPQHLALLLQKARDPHS